MTNKSMFTHKLTGIITSALILAAVSIVSIKSQAQLVVYDGFNYTADVSLTNTSGATYVDSVNSGGDSFGWGNRFFQNSAGGNASNVVTSLSYVDAQGNTLVTDGGSVLIGNSGNVVGANTIIQRAFSSPISSGTYWVSFLVGFAGTQNDPSAPTDYSRLGYVGLAQGMGPGNGNVNPIVSIGRPNTNSMFAAPFDTWTMWTSNGVASAQMNMSSYALSNVTFVTMQIVIDPTAGNNDVIYTWFNWTNLTIAPDISSAVLTTNVNLTTGFNGIRIEADGSTTLVPTVLAFDEFRLGNSFYDVAPVPEPTTVALAAIGGAAMLLIRRRRK